MSAGGGPTFFDLEPLPPAHPRPGDALATPYAIEVTEDDRTLVATAAASDKLFTVDATSGAVLGARGCGRCAAWGRAGWRCRMGTERGRKHGLTGRFGRPCRAAGHREHRLEDPTHPEFKRGRIAFESAAASSTKTASCASCHPDGHTDQLLWVLKTPVVSGGNQIMPRSTMPVRGLRDTAPFHWDGIPGDPYGGTNSASVHRPVARNSDPGRPESATRHLIDGALSSTMLLEGDGVKNDEGKAGLLSGEERDAMSKFLLGVTYPPAQRRAYTNVLTRRATRGFRLFHIEGNFEDKPAPNVCGDCHRMPFWVSNQHAGIWDGCTDLAWRLRPATDPATGQAQYHRLRFLSPPRGERRAEREMWRLSWRSKPRFRVHLGHQPKSERPRQT